MRNSIFSLVTLGGLTICALPAAAESDEGSCRAPPAASLPGPINLEVIPMQDVTGPKAVKSPANDDACGDGSTLGGANFSSGDEDDGQGDDD